MYTGRPGIGWHGTTYGGFTSRLLAAAAESPMRATPIGATAYLQPAASSPWTTAPGSPVPIVRATLRRGTARSGRGEGQGRTVNQMPTGASDRARAVQIIAMGPSKASMG